MEVKTEILKRERLIFFVHVHIFYVFKNNIYTSRRKFHYRLKQKMRTCTVDSWKKLVYVLMTSK